jgi:hypothetical protein
MLWLVMGVAHQCALTDQCALGGSRSIPSGLAKYPGVLPGCLVAVLPGDAVSPRVDDDDATPVRLIAFTQSR